jgi:hypothetical protein
VGRQHWGDFPCQRLHLVVGIGRIQVGKDSGFVKQFAGIVESKDGVIKIGLFFIVGESLDFGNLIGNACFHGRFKMFQLYFVKRRNLERSLVLAEKWIAHISVLGYSGVEAG